MRTIHAPGSASPAARLTDALSVVAAAARHSDHLVGLACKILIARGETAAERKDARVLLLVIDARRPVRRAQREDADRRIAR